MVGEFEHAGRSWQQLRCDCRSTGGENGAFEDDGDPTIWFEPLDRRKEECADEDDPGNMHKR